MQNDWAKSEAGAADPPREKRGMSAERRLAWAAVGCCVVGFGACAALSLDTFGVTALPGCATAGVTQGGCETVQSTRWAWLLGLPVSVWGGGLYVVGLIAAGWQALNIKKNQTLMAWVLLVVAVMAAGAAVWFVYVQAVLLGFWCGWCTATHGVGVVLAGVGAMAWWRGRREVGRFTAAAGVVGVLGVALMAAGQTWLPWEASQTQLGGEIDTVQDGRRVVTILGQATGLPERERRLGLAPAELPLLGGADAEVVAVELMDYTCGACRQLGRRLHAAQGQVGGDRLGVVVLLAPLSHQCNPLVQATADQHADACALAALAAAVWLVNPEVFAVFHVRLLAAEDDASMLSAEEAQALARSLVPAEALEEALRSPRVKAVVDIGIEAQRRSALSFAKGQLPQLFIGPAHVAGTPSVDRIVELVEQASAGD